VAKKVAYLATGDWTSDTDSINALVAETAPATDEG